MKTIADPRLHLSVLVLVATCTFGVQTTLQLYALFFCCLVYVVAHGQHLEATKLGAAFIVAVALLRLLPSRMGVIPLLLLLMLRMMPTLAIGSLLWTSPPGVIMVAGSRLRAPRILLVMLCVFMRFIPVIRQEMNSISHGIRARGLLPHWYSVVLYPARSYECFVLPLIIRGLRLSSEITCAAEFRGMESTLPRSTIYTIASRSTSLCHFFLTSTFCLSMVALPRWIT